MANNYGVDQDGCILTEVDFAKVQAPFKHIIDETKHEALKTFEKIIHSLYLYGSVATGQAQVPTSDIDLLVVFHSKPTSDIQHEINAFQHQVSAKYHHIVREVGISQTDVREVNSDRYGWGCFLKHLCLCLAGESLARALPKFQPSKDVANAFNGNIENRIRKALKTLEATSNENEIGELCRSIMRKIVRTGFCLVMEHERSWTTDLNTSYKVFSKYYPEQSGNMREALTMAQAPIADKHVIGKFLQDFGSWINHEVYTQL